MDNEEARLNLSLLLEKKELQSLLGIREDALKASRESVDDNARAVWKASAESLALRISEQKRLIRDLEEKRDSLRGRDPFD